LAQGADLIIHLSTYAPELASHAEERGHCTAVEAAHIARQADVKRLILTHISPKHDDARPLLAAARAIFANTSVAKDLMDVTLPLSE
jgi:ribonuclease Z